MANINTGNLENETTPYGNPVFKMVLFLVATTSTYLGPFQTKLLGDNDMILSLRQPKN
jgi:hypothetical protein